jgi:hypothetical protein
MTEVSATRDILSCGENDSKEPASFQGSWDANQFIPSERRECKLNAYRRPAKSSRETSELQLSNEIDL